MALDCVVLAVVIATALTALPVSFFLNKLNLMKDSRLVLAAGALCLAGAAALPAWILRRRYRNVDFIIYVFATFCWTTVIDLFVGLELDGLVKGFMGFYIVEGEPYLNSSHGTMINYWDGTAHLLLQLSGISLFTMQESYREVGLYWVGSMVNCLLVLLGGAVLGRSDVKWSILLNVPYVIFPLIAGFRFLRERPLQARSYRRVPPITRRPLDLLFLVFFACALVLGVARGLNAIGAEIPYLRDYVITYEPYLSDPVGFPKVQMLVNMFYFGLYYLCVIDGLLNPGQLWMADWSIIQAGASAQSQFVYLASAIHPKTPKNFRAPKTGVPAAVFWGVNLLLLIVPHLFALRCFKDPDNYGRTYTVDVARPVSQPTTRQSFRTNTSKRE
ncbi:transmembrane 6 superfamily member 1-like [Littorina saxatilis]|uniref:EXPERA domain-containing protein n=1 Tax=Littorina saxatilis TaxID=31220 RepID=A0AAN9GPF4_9CAEN